MNFKVKFFEDSFLDAIGAGVYEICIQKKTTMNNCFM